MDISINDNDFNFKVKTVGLLTNGNKILLVQMNDNGFYCIPGGHVKVDESVQDACIREIEEEVNVKVKIQKKLCVIENFFKSRNKKIHELTFYYLVAPINEHELQTKDFAGVDNGNVKLSFKWFDIDKLDDVDFRPQVIKDKIIARNFDFEFITFNQL